MHPSSLRAFQRQQEHDLKHPSLVDLITTKQNKLPSFIDRFMLGVLVNGPTWQIWKKKPSPWLVAGFFLWINLSYFVNIFFLKNCCTLECFFGFSSHQIFIFFGGVGANHQISLLGSSKMWRPPKHFFLLYIVYSQIWVNFVMDDHNFSYNTKTKKKKKHLWPEYYFSSLG
jgi:hypothetical protein